MGCRRAPWLGLNSVLSHDMCMWKNDRRLSEAEIYIFSSVRFAKSSVFVSVIIFFFFLLLVASSRPTSARRLDNFRSDSGSTVCRRRTNDVPCRSVSVRPRRDVGRPQARRRTPRRLRSAEELLVRGPGHQKVPDVSLAVSEQPITCRERPRSRFRVSSAGKPCWVPRKRAIRSTSSW